MNNKELQQQLAQQLSITQKESAQFLNAFVETYSRAFDTYEDAQVPFLKFGTMVVKKKDQRFIVNPVTKIKMLIPPKLVISFKPSTNLKNTIRKIEY